MIEPRLAPTADLDGIVDWASKLVGAVARLSGLLHLADLAPDLPLHTPVGASLAAPATRPVPPVSPGAVDAAVVLAHYLIAHARAAYAAMGLDPAASDVPQLLNWLRRARLRRFTRRDAHRALGSRIRSAYDLDDALDQLEQHSYIRLRTAPPRTRQGRPPSPHYDVHPSLIPS